MVRNVANFISAFVIIASPFVSEEANAQQQDTLPAKKEKIAMYPNLSFKGVFVMPTWFLYTGDWQALAFTMKGKTCTGVLQVNQQLPGGFCVDLVYNQPFDGKGNATLYASKKIFGGKAAVGATLSTDRPLGQAGFAAQANIIHTDKMLVSIGEQVDNVFGKASARTAFEARRSFGGKVAGIGGYAVLSDGKITEYGGSVGSALRNGKGARVNIGASVSGGKISDIRLGFQFPTKKWGMPDVRLGMKPGKKPTFDAKVFWTLPRGR